MTVKGPELWVVAQVLAATWLAANRHYVGALAVGALFFINVGVVIGRRRR